MHDIYVVCMMYVYWGECVCFYLGAQKTIMLLTFKMYSIKEEFKQKKKTLWHVLVSEHKYIHNLGC